jgi:hypothetical protein
MLGATGAATADVSLNRSVGLRQLCLALLAVLSLVLSGCAGDRNAAGAPGQPLGPGSPTPDFALPSATGGTLALADYAGRQPVLLYFHMAVG